MKRRKDEHKIGNGSGERETEREREGERERNRQGERETERERERERGKNRGKKNLDRKKKEKNPVKVGKQKQKICLLLTTNFDKTKGKKEVAEEFSLISAVSQFEITICHTLKDLILPQFDTLLHFEITFLN